ncbi:MAG TPA: homocysteine S-methyltransferase family protein [Candidatus Egerieenecus merdigallinarum]|nr:homocysteine S-methyltransferase family protein [Candidatus Egerieenecus merdigallinarum]
MKLEELLGKRLVFVDGGMGTMLQAAGLTGGEAPERWNLTHPETVAEVHRAYLAAGCDIVTANTFGATGARFGAELQKVIQAGVKLARQGVEEAGHGFAAFDMGPTGKLLAPYGELPFQEAVSLYRQAAAWGAEAGADLIIIETMGDPYEMKAAVLGAREACDLPILATMMADVNGRLLTGGTVETMAVLLDGLGVTALGLNCGLGGPEMLPLLRRIRRVTERPLLCSPNAGLPRMEGGRTVFPAGPEAFAQAQRELAQAGAWLLGGCCGTTPEHIRAMVAACREVTPAPVPPVTETWISSGSEAVCLDHGPVVIGERINPTGKKRMQEALRTGDVNYLLKEAVNQSAAGAAVLDVNVGLGGMDEAAWMERAVSAIQGVCTCPLQLDTADPEALARGLRAYNGKALINSVSGKQEVMDQVFPLAKRYGGTVVALLLDEEGIPDTAEGRVAIARRIMAEAARYGIAKRDLVMDALTMTVSTGERNALVTLETLRRCREELGVRTVLGVSNISFGLPQREKLAGPFLTLALGAGLDAAILNPLSEAMMDAWQAALTLTGRDKGCRAYLERFAGAAPVKSGAQAAFSLEEAVRRGLRAEAERAARERLSEGEAPMDLVEKRLLPALTQVGDGYEAGTLFLPQLLMSAEAAQGAFALVQQALGEKSTGMRRQGRIALATVEGDIHDIGKNIVKVLLESYGFEVLDLGKNVKPEQVLAAVQAEKLHMVGLSALMTTTVPAMERTIALLRREAPDCRVVVGGAVLTPELAAAIGAHAYARDAMDTVRFARENA